MTQELCKFEECVRPVEIKSHKLCRAHYKQQWKGKPLTPLRDRNTFNNPTPDTRICTKCMRVLPLGEFYLRVTGKPHSNCKKCMIASNSRNQANRKAQQRAQEASEGA